MHVRILFLTAAMAIALPATAVDRIPVLNESTTSDHWSVVPGTASAPVYPEMYASGQRQVCVTIGYLLNADGHVSDFALLKSWSDGGNSVANDKFWSAFAESASKALAGRQFVPKQRSAAPSPVYTASTFAFGLGDSAATQAHCEISDLASRLLELQRDTRSRRLMATGIFPRLDIDSGLDERMRQQRLLAHEKWDQRQMVNASWEQRQEQQRQEQQRLVEQRQSQSPSNGK